MAKQTEAWIDPRFARKHKPTRQKVERPRRLSEDQLCQSAVCADCKHAVVFRTSTNSEALDPSIYCSVLYLLVHEAGNEEWIQECNRYELEQPQEIEDEAA
jgi:hypothetical protein